MYDWTSVLSTAIWSALTLIPRAQRGQPGRRRRHVYHRDTDVGPSREKANREVNELLQAFAEDPSRGGILIWEGTPWQGTPDW